MARKYAPRHRAARRPITPLTGINTAANRRKAAAVAATGLGVAFAVSSNAVAAGDAVKGADVVKLASQAKSALEANPQVAVAKDAKWVSSDTTTAVVAVEPPRVAPIVAHRPVRQREQHSVAPAGQQADVAPAAQQADVAPTASIQGGSVVDIALRYRGIPYVWGGNTPAGFDCSGFTRYVYAQRGISLPRTAGAQARRGHAISRANARPGDLMYWGSSHVGIYLGNGMMIDAGRPGTRIHVHAVYGNPGFRRF